MAPLTLETTGAPILAGVFALLGSLLITPVAINLAVKYGATDDPSRDQRRIHTEVTPRWGGIPVFLGFLIAAVGLFFLVPPDQRPYLWAIIIGGLIISIMGMIDDKAGLSAPQQLIYMVLVGLAVQFVPPAGVLQIQSIELPWVGPVHFYPGFALFATAAFIFMGTKTADTIDGSDGLATGLAAISAITFAVLSAWSGNVVNAVLAGGLAGACLGFLRYNFNPAKIFLAGGAQFVGFVLTCIAISGPFKNTGPLALLIPFTVLGVPMVDAMVVVIRRILARQNIAHGDRRHVHHVLLGFGISSRRTAFVLYLAAMALCGTFLILVRARG